MQGLVTAPPIAWIVTRAKNAELTQDRFKLAQNPRMFLLAMFRLSCQSDVDIHLLSSGLSTTTDAV